MIVIGAFSVGLGLYAYNIPNAPETENTIHEEITHIQEDTNKVEQIADSDPVIESIISEVAVMQLAFTSNRDGNLEIYLTNSDGTDVRRLTYDTSVDMSPAWSPDGKYIAFMSERDGNWEIYAMNYDGSDLFKITDHPGSERYPAWSADGNKISLVSDRTGNQEIFMINTDSGELFMITNHPADDRYSAWAPVTQ